MLPATLPSRGCAPPSTVGSSPDDPGYDQARSVFYGSIDRRPAVIVRPTGATEVAQVLPLARESGLELAVRCGSHSLAGHGTSEEDHTEGACDALCVLTLTGTRPSARFSRLPGGLVPLSYCPRSSPPAHVLAWLAARLAHLVPSRPPGTGGTPPLSLEVRLVAAVLLDGLSYRRAGGMVGISKTAVGDSLDLLLGPLAAVGLCQPDGSFITSLDDLRRWLAEMAGAGEPVMVDGLATRVQRPRGWANQKLPYDAKRHAHTAQGLAVSTIHGDLLWLDGGWPGSCHEQELLKLSGLEGTLDGVEVAGLLDRGFRGLAKTREHWHAPVGDRRTRGRLSEGVRDASDMERRGRRGARPLRTVSSAGGPVRRGGR